MIPTATSLIRNKFPNHDGVFVLRNIEEFMIEFAKLHVKQALDARDRLYQTHFPEIIWTEENKKFIQNSYPLTNIK